MHVRLMAWQTGLPFATLAPASSPPVNPSPVAAVVGTGFIGPVHVEALRRLGIRVKGILGASAAKSEAAASSLKLEVGYRSLSAMLADRDVNVVHLASPNRAHKEQVLAALEA